MNSESKRQLGVLDRISGLPDALLWHILSFLETHYAVRTCILSTRWKNIWASVPTLDFSKLGFSNSAKFVAFVDYVLFFRHSSNIHKFRLLWTNEDVEHSRVNAWINTAIKRNVVEIDLYAMYPSPPQIDYVLFFRHSSNIHKFRLLWTNEDVEHSRVNAWINTAIKRNVVEIDLYAMYPSPPQIFELPQSLFMCRTLESLKLRSPFISNLPASGWFPNLKSLYVKFNREVHETMLKVFSNLPKLEDLTIHGYSRYGSPQILKIAAPALKTLRLGLYTTDDGINCYNYLINCPKLENLYVNEGVPSTYYWGKAKSLVRTRIYLDQHCSNEQPSFYRVTALLAGVSNVTDLYLSAHCFEVGSLPIYENLRQLKLVVHDCFCWELLTELLKISPLLESLVLERKVGCQLSSEDSGSEEGSDHEEVSENEQGSYVVDGPVNEQGSEHEVDSKSEEGSVHKEGSDHEDGSESIQGSEHQWSPPDGCCWLHLKFVSL